MADAAGVDLSGFGLQRQAFIGKGHFASVQLVREVDTGERYVAKCVRLGSLSERDQRLANQEVFLLEALSHPLIVAYHDSFLLEGQDVLVILMEHCEGGDLRHAIAERAQSGRHFPEEQVLTWFAQIALGLQYIHQQKVLHRDLKCSNIFLVGRSVVKLGDFGISRVFESSTDQCNTLVGTPYYMSPEVCSSQPYSYKSDIWSLGCVLYELCVLKHAFDHSTLQGLIHRIKSGVYEPLPDIYSQELNALVRSLLTIAPEQRPSIDEVCNVPLLQPYVAHQRGELLGMPAVDVEAKEKSKQQRRLLKGFSDEVSLKGRPPSGEGGVGELLSAGAESGAVLEPPVLEPQDMSTIAAFRARRLLVDRGQDLGTALLPYAGGGGMSRESLREALAELKLGLSMMEVNFLESALPRAEGQLITVAALQAKLEEAGTSQKMDQLHSWAKQVLRAPVSRLQGCMEVRDAQRSGFLTVSDFQAALTEVAPALRSDETMLLLLLADKNASGEAEYATFACRFGIPSIGEETAFYTCAAEDIQIAAAVREAWS